MPRLTALAVSAMAPLAALIAPPAAASESLPSGRWSLPATGLAPTPPMGWNSWNAFGVNLDEERVMASARILVASGLAEAGYRYVNLDDGWWLQRRESDGRMQVRTNLLPSAKVGGREGTSLRPFTDRLHAMGLKAGIYSDIGRNACSQAYAPNSPNLPVGDRAEREVGLYGHVAQDIALYFGAWNFDYIKADACGLSSYGPDRPWVANGRYRALGPLVYDTDVNRSDIAGVRSLYGALRDALLRVRPKGDFVLSLCLWGAANVRAWGQDVGTLWRTSNDIDASWGRMLHNLDSVATRELYAGPGHWNDPDMLEIGNGQFDGAHLTEARAQMSLWAIEAAPLIIGTDLAKAPRAILDLLGNREVIAVDQDGAGNQGVLAYTDDEREIIVKTLTGRGLKAVVLFNRTAEPTDMTLTAAHLGFAPDKPIALRDLWAHAGIGAFTGERAFHLAAHEAILLTAGGAPVLGSGIYLSEMPARIHVAEDGIRALEADPMIHRMMDPWHPSTTSDGDRPVYAGWGAPRADATPYGESLRMRTIAFRRGIGVLAGARLEVKADRAFTRFSANVGIDDSSRGKSTPVRFEVWGDGRLLAASAPLRFGDAAVPLAAGTAGVETVELIVRQLGSDTDGPAIADWGEAHFDTDG